MLATVAHRELNDRDEDRGVGVRAAQPATGLSTLRTEEPRGTRMGMAFRAMETFPVLVASRDRLLSATVSHDVSTAEVVSAVESDIGLCIAVMNAANTREHGSGRGCVETVLGATQTLRPRTIQALASRARTFDFFERTGIWQAAPEAARRHALATQRIADRIASEVSYKHRDRLAVTSLLHDVGKLVLVHAHPGYPTKLHDESMTPSQRVARECQALGVDHAAIGGVLLRRWGLPISLANAVEAHHNPEAGGEAALIRLADMLAHFEQGARIRPGELTQSAHAVGLSTEQLRQLMCSLPGACANRPLPNDPCPLSGQERRVLQQLAKGGVYKEIAIELNLSPSTVRTHFHNIYRTLGVANRAQAVLLATSRGWL